MESTIVMASTIKELIDGRETNPHAVSKEAGLTYRIVLELYHAPQIKLSTPIGTLIKIASALDVEPHDLYTVKLAELA
jgi:hypothetical protein